MGTKTTVVQPAIMKCVWVMLCSAQLVLVLSILAVVILTVTLREEIINNDDKILGFADFTEAMCNDNMLDVAVVGAGASGSYSAYKLSKVHPDWKIHVFDANNRIGGRLYSVHIPGIGDFKADLGAMRYKTSHTHLVKLIEELGLATQNFTTPNSDDTLYYFKEMIYGKQDIETGNVPFNMTTQERQLSADSDALMAYWNKLVLSDSSVDIANPWKRRCRDGAMAYEKGLYNALTEVASNGAVDYLAYRGEFPGDFFNNMNYAEWSEPTYEEVNPSVSHTTVKQTQLYAITKGFEELVKEMIHRTLQKSETRLYLNHRLTTVKHNKEGLAQLQFYDQATKKYMNVCAKKVVLGIPPEAISRIQLHDNDLNMAISPLLEIVEEGPSVKTYLAYDRPWWRTDGQGQKFDELRNKGIDLKFIVTDNAMGTILEIGIDKTTGKALLLTYADSYKHTQFWEPYQETGTLHYSYLEADFTVSNNLIHQMNIQLSKIFNIELSSLPQPYAVVSHAWHKSPYWTAWHLYSAGYNFPENKDKILKPVSSKDFYIIGEAFSDIQGWTEGALHTADKMLRQYFHVYS